MKIRWLYLGVGILMSIIGLAFATTAILLYVFFIGTPNQGMVMQVLLPACALILFMATVACMIGGVKSLLIYRDFKLYKGEILSNKFCFYFSLAAWILTGLALAGSIIIMVQTPNRAPWADAAMITLIVIYGITFTLSIFSFLYFTLRKMMNL